jgi:LmbE family N-acetylglucosaminyl deacetylase
MIMNIIKVLVLSPHTDDGELGAGGTIVRFIDEGKEVYYVVFSSCGASIPTGMPRDIVKRECLRATKILGVLRDRITLMDYEVRTFPEHRQQILDDLIKLKEKIKPDLVLAPSSSDTHQDHNTIYWETLRAFKKESSIWGYEHPWNNISFSTDIFIRLEQEHLERKLEALKCYKSQRNKGYFDEAYLRSLVYTRGAQVDWHYAEAFELTRLLV